MPLPVIRIRRRVITHWKPAHIHGDQGMQAASQRFDFIPLASFQIDNPCDLSRALNQNYTALSRKQSPAPEIGVGGMMLFASLLSDEFLISARKIDHKLASTKSRKEIVDAHQFDVSRRFLLFERAEFSLLLGI